MSRIISDFIKSADTAAGFGYFEGKPYVSNYSRAMGKSQKRKYKRYGIIPRAFFDF